jgi:hypothetical protein
MATLVQTPEFPGAAGVVSVSFWRRWRYTGGKRDVRLDFLRGFAVFAMVVDHVSGRSSWLYFVTGGDAFYVSAAEAFLFISGLVMGMVYRGIVERHGIGVAVSKSLKRAWTLYALTVLLTLSFAAVSSLLDLPWALHLTPRSVPAFVIGVLTLHQTFHLADVLLMYTFLVAGVGPLLALLARGRTRWILAGSWGLWLVWQIWPAQAQIPWAIDGNEVFQLAAWQALFVTALVLGYHRRTLEQRLAGLSATTVLLAGGLLVAAAAVMYFRVLGSPYAQGTLAAQLFGKPDVRVGRVIVFGGAFGFAFALTTVAWEPLRRLLSWLLLPLGHHALTAYALHIFVVAALWKAALVFLGENRSPTQNALIELAGVAIVWAAIVLLPELATVADCCLHCQRAGLHSLERMFTHANGHATPLLAGSAVPKGEAVAGDVERSVAGGPAACGHAEPHADCP